MMIRAAQDPLCAAATACLLVAIGCASTTDGNREAAPRAADDTTSALDGSAAAPEGPILPEEDRIVAMFEPDAGGADPQGLNRRSAGAQVDPRPSAEGSAARPDGGGEAAPAIDNSGKEAVHRTSMPEREKSSGKSARTGGVRKAVPVDQQASALFGLWRVDRAASSGDLIDADRVLFLADGRMRVWRNSTSEDGRWTWTVDAGVKTGGLEGVAFSLGEFALVDGKVVIAPDEEKRLVLAPDRIFVAPAPRKTAKVEQRP